MSKVLVTGAQGQLGRTLHEIAPWSEVVFLSHADLDIASRTAVQEVFRSYRPDWVVNCAAYTAVDRAEVDPEAAYRVNALGPRLLAESAVEVGAHLLHISTDYVFGGVGNLPHREEDVPAPEGVYAQSKRAGEIAVLSTGNALVLRTSWLYSYYDRNFFHTILLKCLQGTPLRVIYDQVGTPTWATHLAQAIVSLVTQNRRSIGIYHYSDLGVASWFDFACYLRMLLGTTNTILPIRSEEWKSAAPRPACSVLDSQATRASLGLFAVSWLDGVRECFEELRQRDNGDFFRKEYLEKR